MKTGDVVETLEEEEVNTCNGDKIVLDPGRKALVLRTQYERDSWLTVKIFITQGVYLQTNIHETKLKLLPNMVW